MGNGTAHCEWSGVAVSGKSRGIEMIFSRGEFVDKEIYVPLQPRT